MPLQYGYTIAKIRKKYSKFEGELIYVCLNKGTNGLGLSLAGHKDRRQVSNTVQSNENKAS